jgi:hypothetical protein
MRNKKRSFHAIVPMHSFVFHVRNDVPPKKGDIANDVTLHNGTRAATVVVMIKNGLVTFGIARCEWDYQFNKKLARSIATGRAKQAFTKDPALMREWWKQSIHGELTKESGKDFWYEYARDHAIELVIRLTERSEEIDNAKHTR